MIWAPISAFLIHRMFGMAGFTFLGFAEEMLPFTDVIPTATITWFWINAVFIPVWIIRIQRRVQRGEPPFVMGPPLRAFPKSTVVIKEE